VPLSGLRFGNMFELAQNHGLMLVSVWAVAISPVVLEFVEGAYSAWSVLAHGRPRIVELYGCR